MVVVSLLVVTARFLRRVVSGAREGRASPPHRHGPPGLEGAYSWGVPAVLYSADVLCSMTGPPLANGAVLVRDDRIVAVGPAQTLRDDADRRHHVDGVLLPGLVNAGTALEHADAAALAVAGPLDGWIRALAATTGEWTEEQWGRSAHRGILQALRAGTTAVFDTVCRGPAVPAACRAGLAGDSWVEVFMADHEHRDAVLAAVERALALSADGRRVGIAPHSPWALGTGVLQALAALAARCGAALHVRAAQTPAEAAALATGSGPLADLARERHMEFEWLGGGAHQDVVGYLDACSVLRAGTSLAGGVGIDEAGVRLLADRGVTVVCRPRADALRGAGELALERYAGSGPALALGTGSPAEVGDVDVLAEASAWARLAASRGLREWPSAAGPVPLDEQAVRLATVDGARAMGWGNRAGVLEPGRRADLAGVALTATPRSVYRDLLTRGPGRQVLTVVGGVRKARRDDADRPWPLLDDDAWRP